MLLITRKPGQTFTIGDEVSVKITAVHGNQVRIAIDAPKHIEIKRDDMKKDKDNG